MAILSDSDRKKITTGLMRYWSQWFEHIDGLTKNELRLAIDATDDWIEIKQGEYNLSLPAIPRSRLTLAQKTLIFCTVAAFRVSKEFAIRLIGGID